MLQRCSLPWLPHKRGCTGEGKQIGLGAVRSQLEFTCRPEYHICNTPQQAPMSNSYSQRRGSNSAHLRGMGKVPPALAVIMITPFHSGFCPSLPAPGLGGRLGAVAGLPVSMARAASRTPSST